MFPERCRVFAPYPLYLMMVFLFLSFLKIEFVKILQDVRKTASALFVLCLFKLILLPAGLYFLSLAIWPKYAVPVLLLSGVSTGVVSIYCDSSGRLSPVGADDGRCLLPSGAFYASCAG